MTYSIYSYGGGEILWKVFNGVALLFASDSPYFTSIGKLTLIIGLIFTGVQAFTQVSIPILAKKWFLPTIFLTALFFGPKASVHIIDKVDNDFQYSKVDNIPIGIALVASLTTHVSECLTTSIETVFASSDVERFSKVGPLFASRLIHEARSISIKDPLLRENIKDFVRQCFAWPYVFSNISPGKKAALESIDILGFIEANPHPLLGVYWRDGTGNAIFKNCSECSATVKSAITVEVETGLQSIAMRLFNGSGDDQYADPTTQQAKSDVSSRLRLYFGNAWQSLVKGSSDTSNIIQQELMLNSYREALQDKRDELGLGRFDESLVYLNAERGRSQQNASFLVKAAMSGIHVPTCQTILFALAIIYFALIAPMTFLPNGLSLVTTWGKVMVWLSTWPPLISIINSLGQLYAAKATATTLLGHEGLNLMTQNGLADVSFDAYCFVMGLQWSVPFLSWALISGGGYAFSQMASSFTQGGEAFAGKAAAEITDGNVSFDSQTMHHRSVANSQMAQQQLGPSINSGSRFDDGKILSIHGPNGQTAFQEHQTQLGINVSQNDSLSTAYGEESQRLLNVAENNSRSSGEQLNKGSSETFNMLKSATKSTGLTDTIGDTNSTNAQKSLNTAMDTVSKFAKDHHMSKDKAFKILLSAGMSTGVSGKKGLLGKMGGVMGALNVGANGQFDVSASDREAISEAKSSGKSKQFIDNLSSGIQYLEDHKGSISDTHVKQHMDQASESLSKSEQYAEQSGINKSDARNWSQRASLMRQKNMSIGENRNDPILEKVAQDKYGGDKRAAASWQVENPTAYRKYASGYVNHNEPEFKREIKNNGYQSHQEVSDHYKGLEDKMQKPEYKSEKLDAMRAEHDIDGKERVIKEKHDKLDKNTRGHMKTHQEGIKKDDIQADIDQQSHAYDRSKKRYLAKKAYNKAKKWNG